jgi:hypothetical protein
MLVTICKVFAFSMFPNEKRSDKVPNIIIPK